MPLNHVTVLGMIVAELVTNSYRHAFPKITGTVTVSLARGLGSGGAILTVQDDGVGFAVTQETSRRGVVLVKNLIEQMGGTMDVRSVAGTLWTLVFPVEAAIPVPS